jgi:hypothetical protein
VFNPFFELVIACVLILGNIVWCVYVGDVESFCALPIPIGTLLAAVFHLGHVVGAHAVRLRLVIDNSIDCLPTSNKDWGDGAKLRRFVRLKLYNDSTNMAVDACVKLLSIYECCARVERPLGYVNPQYLRWNTENKSKDYANQNLPNGGPQYVDLLFTELKDKVIRVVLTDEPYSAIGLPTERTYRFNVQATAAQARAATVQFYVTIGNTYDEILIKHYRPIFDGVANWLNFQRSGRSYITPFNERQLRVGVG